MNQFLPVVISFFGLLTVSSYASVLGKRFHFPHTIVLFIIGILIIYLGKLFPFLSFLATIEFSKELVFYIFLPTLIFESAYNMSYKKIMMDAVPISFLAIFSLLISAFIIGFLLKIILGLIGLSIPYSVSFLFGAIISATDPVAALAIFKEFGVPKRISYLFEGESIFNDGTAVALFLIIFDIIRNGAALTSEGIFYGFLTFISMILGGIGFGLFMGIFFSKLIEWVRDSWAELTLTLIMAHTTFIIADLISEEFAIFKISAIIATTISCLTVGNYGRYKISKKVREMIQVTWGYLAFLSNSLIFLLMGMLIGRIDFHLKILAIPIIVVIFIVILARIVSVISVFAAINRFLDYPICWGWQKLIAWGSLRGAIAITMLLFIPKDFTVPDWYFPITVYEFLSVITIACIIFTLVFKTYSLKNIIKKMELADMTVQEEFNFHQIKKIIDKSIIKKLDNISTNQSVSKEVLHELKDKYLNDDKFEECEIRKCHLKKVDFMNLLTRYSLGIERMSVREFFESKQIDEYTLKRILNKIEVQYLRIEIGLGQFKSFSEKQNILRAFLKKIQKYIYSRGSKKQFLLNRYVFLRARILIAEKVINHLKKFRVDFYADPNCKAAFDEIINQYFVWLNNAKEKIQPIIEEIHEEVHKKEVALFNNHLIFVESKMIDDLYQSRIMNGKVKAAIEESLRKT